MHAENEVTLHYAPHDPSTGSKQLDFLLDRHRAFYRAGLAGTGGGKTYMAAWETLDIGIREPPGVGLLCEPDYKMVKKVMIPKMEAVLGAKFENSPLVHSWNKSDMRLELINPADPNQDGWVFWFMGLEDPEKAEGPDVDLAWVDEARLVRRWDGPQGAWMTIRRRLRGTRPEGFRGAYITTHSPTKAQYDFFIGPDRNPRAKAYQWSTLAALEAGTLPADFEEVVRSHTGAAYDRVILGEYARAEGLVLDAFNPEEHVRVHKGPFRSTSYGIDWGWTDPMCITAWGWNGSRAHGLEEFYGSHYDIQEIILQCKRLQARHGKGVFWCGHDQPEHINTLRRNGINARPYVGKIEDGIGIMNSMCRGNELTVDPGMKEWRREADNWGRDPNTGKPEEGDEHAMDSGRYAIMGHKKQRRAKSYA